MGDLNYRITDLSTNHVRTLVAQKEYDTLLKVDQLSQQRERGNVLLVSCLCFVIYLFIVLKIVCCQDYEEGNITFQPTYKFDLFTDVYDTSEKARPPAWTDRILWRGRGIHQVCYRYLL